MNIKRITGSLCALSCAVLLAACGPEVTNANFEQIEVGMSMVEVEGIIGGSGEKQEVRGSSIGATGVESAGNSGDDRQTYVWADGNKQIIIVFEDGQVSSKRQTGLTN